MTAGIPSEAASGPARPVLRIVRGDPSPEEIAALVAVLATRGGTAPVDPAPASGWRALPSAGPAAWRLSGFVKGVRTRASW